jgi:hypothetical protein
MKKYLILHKTLLNKEDINIIKIIFFRKPYNIDLGMNFI